MITKIDNDTVKITNTSDTLVKISHLQDKLETMKIQKEIYDSAVAYKATMPEEMQQFFAEPPSMTDEQIQEMESKINTYKALK